MICMTFTFAQVKYYRDDNSPLWFMFVLFMVIIIFCFQPLFKCGYRTARYQLAYTIWQIMISPFGLVRFRDFFFADVITSVPSSLTDISVALYFYLSAHFWRHERIDMTALFIVVCSQVASFIPFWFRFWQCINKYYYASLTA